MHESVKVAHRSPVRCRRQPQLVRVGEYRLQAGVKRRPDGHGGGGEPVGHGEQCVRVRSKGWTNRQPCN